MSLPEISLAQGVKNQYIATMRTLGVSFYRNLLFLELLFGLLSYYNSIPAGWDWWWFNSLYLAQLRTISDGMSYWIALLYVAAMGWILAGKRWRNTSFTFVSNRLSYNLSNMATLFTFSALASLIATLNMVLMRVIFAYVSPGVVFFNGFRLAPHDLGICWAACFGYSLLAGAAVYLLTVILIRQPKIALVFPLALLVYIIVPNSIDICLPLIWFFLGEANLLLFLLKTILTVLLCFAIAYPVSRRLEVRH